MIKINSIRVDRRAQNWITPLFNLHRHFDLFSTPQFRCYAFHTQTKYVRVWNTICTSLFFGRSPRISTPRHSRFASRIYTIRYFFLIYSETEKKTLEKERERKANLKQSKLWNCSIFRSFQRNVRWIILFFSFIVFYSIFIDKFWFCHKQIITHCVRCFVLFCFVYFRWDFFFFPTKFNRLVFFNFNCR